ncbi:phage tail tube protein [Azospirillum thermophilum]|uniref:Phage tail protein n=1 Tax=Azospirillum thermophilum TaxID=2202148 RepID=A0A2S2D0Y7_9PROT|nr:phage tail tube protein [Azospirillum thermophilum]AWK90348.1 hypothetical protein DEW08_30510 [Azospirillum thermophilum]
MTSSNRVRLTGVAESVPGTTPANPRMRKQRVTSIGLTSKTDYEDSAELRDDRMNADPMAVGQTNGGQLAIEWHYPVPGSLLDAEIASAFCNDWVNTPSRENDGTPASAIASVTAATQVVAVAAGTAFAAGHLVLFSGFSAANNGVRKVTTGSATVPAFAASGLVDDAAPGAAARMKVVGAEGAAGDITATLTGLASTALDFTTLGLSVGQWVKIGGTAAGYRFDTDGCNVWARIIGIAAHALTLDNRPAAGWAVDAGAGKTIRLWFGDTIRNGVAIRSVSLERGYMGQTTPTYIVQAGMRVNTLEFGGAAKKPATGSVSFMGMGGGSGTVSLDDTPDEAPDMAAYPVMAFSANCGRIGVGGSALGRPDWARSIKFTINNNLRARDALSDGDAFSPGPVEIADGSCDVAVELDTFFGSSSLLQLIETGQQVGVNCRLEKGGRAMIWEAPRLTAKEGDPAVGGKNQDVTLAPRFSASKDSLTGAQLLLNRIEYYQ